MPPLHEPEVIIKNIQATIRDEFKGVRFSGEVMVRIQRRIHELLKPYISAGYVDPASIQLSVSGDVNSPFVGISKLEGGPFSP